MHLVGLLLWLAVLQAFGARPGEVLLAGPAKDVCGLARQISSMGPCLGPENCPSLDTFLRHFGTPGPRLLPPGPGKGRWGDGRRWFVPGPRSQSRGPLICLVEDPP